MFGFGKKKEKARNRMMTDQELNDYFYPRIMEQAKLEPGNADFSFLKELGENYLESEVLSDIQSTIIKTIIYIAIKDVVCNNNIYGLVPHIKDLMTVPEFHKLASPEVRNGEALNRLQRFMNMNTLKTDMDIETQLNELQNEFDEVYENAGNAIDIWTAMVSAQEYAGGKAQKEKSVSDAVRELEDCLLISFSDKQIAMLKTALLTYALNYENLYVDTPESMVSEEGENLNNIYDLFFESPYKMLFGKIMTEDILVSKIIIEGKTNKDMQIQQAIEKFIKDNQNVKDFQMSIKKIREILTIYGLEDMVRLLKTDY